MLSPQCEGTFFRFADGSDDYPTKLGNLGANALFLGAKPSKAAPDGAKIP
jgi:hypothetical protein